MLLRSKLKKIIQSLNSGKCSKIKYTIICCFKATIQLSVLCNSKIFQLDKKKNLISFRHGTSVATLQKKRVFFPPDITENNKGRKSIQNQHYYFHLIEMWGDLSLCAWSGPISRPVLKSRKGPSGGLTGVTLHHIHPDVPLAPVQAWSGTLNMSWSRSERGPLPLSPGGPWGPCVGSTLTTITVSELISAWLMPCMPGSLPNFYRGNVWVEQQKMSGLVTMAT